MASKVCQAIYQFSSVKFSSILHVTFAIFMVQHIQAWNKMAITLQTFSNAFSWLKTFEFEKESSIHVS